MASVTGQKRTHLSLEKKVEVIRKSKDNPSIGLRALAENPRYFNVVRHKYVLY